MRIGTYRGFYSIAGSSNCTLCPAGYYIDDYKDPERRSVELHANISACKKCKSGTYSDSTRHRCLRYDAAQFVDIDTHTLRI